VRVVVWGPPRTPQAIRNNFGGGGKEKMPGRRPSGVIAIIIGALILVL
jgi:hypothetical protein